MISTTNKKDKFNIEVKSWILYDLGNSAFFTTVLAAFFPLFFASYWSDGLEDLISTQYLTVCLTITNLFILLCAPIIGAVSDFMNLTKQLFIFFTLLGACLVGSFFFIDQGEYLTPLILYGIALFSASSGIVLYDKMLLQITRHDQLTKVSSYGYAFGYLGGGFLFAVNAFMVLEPSLFGLNDDVDATKWAFVTVAVWWTIFLIPLVLNYDNRPIKAQGNLKDALFSVYETLKSFSKIAQNASNRNALIFLIAFFFYIDGVHTVMSLAAIFGDNIGIEQSSIITALIVVQFVGFPATLFWSYIGNKFSDKFVIYSTIFIYFCGVIFSMFLSTSTEFFILAALIGSVQGGIQAASRSLFSKLIPPHQSGEFFGLYNTFGRAGAVMGPALVGLFIGVFESIRIALLPVIILFFLGAVILYFVKINPSNFQNTNEII